MNTSVRLRPMLRQQLLEELAGGADEGASLLVLVVAGASPISMISASTGPSPGTARVRPAASGQAWQALTPLLRSPSAVRRSASSMMTAPK